MIKDLEFLKETPPWEWPPDAGEILVGALRNDQNAVSDRVIAAELAGDLVVMDDKKADLLLSIARNAGEPEQLRAQAAISLGPALEETDSEGLDDDITEPPISEDIFLRIQKTLRQIYTDESAPKEVRRRVLEASVRAPQDWHNAAIHAADSSDDDEWKLTAAFCMRWVRGFDERILQMIESKDPDIQYEAVRAAGNWALKPAWPRIAALIASEDTDKNLRLGAIEAASYINPRKARRVLAELTNSEDEDIADAAIEAVMMAQTASENM